MPRSIEIFFQRVYPTIEDELVAYVKAEIQKHIDANNQSAPSSTQLSESRLQQLRPTPLLPLLQPNSLAMTWAFPGSNQAALLNLSEAVCPEAEKMKMPQSDCTRYKK